MGTNQWGAPFGYSQMLGLPGYVDNLQSVDVVPVGSTVTSWAGRSGVVTLTPRTTPAIYATNAQGTLPSVSGDGSAVVMSSAVFLPPANKMYLYMVGRLPSIPAVNTTSVLFEFGSSPTTTAGAKGVSWQYLYNPASYLNATCSLQSGSSGGTASIKGTVHNLSLDIGTNYRAICIAIDRSQAWPITVGVSVAPGTDLWIANSKQPSGILSAQAGVISQFDNTNFNFFGRWTGSVVAACSTMSLINAFIYAPSVAHTYSQIRNGLRYLSNFAGV